MRFIYLKEWNEHWLSYEEKKFVCEKESVRFMSSICNASSVSKVHAATNKDFRLDGK